MTKEAAELVRKDELRAFLTSDLAKEIGRAKALYREFRFHATLPAEEFTLTQKDYYRNATIFSQGVADLILVRRDESLLLVDYKTDRIPHAFSDEDAAALLFSRHKTQLSAYAKALTEVFGREPEIAIYSLPRGKMFRAV
jgi:ATP-dependent exoDNAse (exonuclease V) beta subunit